MAHRLILTITVLALLLMAFFATMPSYRTAPAFLIPLVWGIYMLRFRLHTTAASYAMISSAVLVHMLGAFGFYQKSRLPMSFDIVVHYYFALAATPLVYRALQLNIPLRTWQVNIAALLVVMGSGALHEIMEYGTYLVLGEEKGMLKPATSYFFDTQRDLTNNLLGTLTALIAIQVYSRFRRDNSNGTSC